jgi:methionine aminopeptidase
MIFTVEPIFNLVRSLSSPLESSPHLLREREMLLSHLRTIGLSSHSTGVCKSSIPPLFASDADRSAQCEHEVLITEHGPEVITVSGF